MCSFLFVSVNYGSKVTIRCSGLYIFFCYVIFSQKFDFFEVSVGFSFASDRKKVDYPIN